jgi:hypothetical protein
MKRLLFHCVVLLAAPPTLSVGRCDEPPEPGARPGVVSKDAAPVASVVIAGSLDR